MATLVLFAVVGFDDILISVVLSCLLLLAQWCGLCCATLVLFLFLLPILAIQICVCVCVQASAAAANATDSTVVQMLAEWWSGTKKAKKISLIGLFRTKCKGLVATVSGMRVCNCPVCIYAYSEPALHSSCRLVCALCRMRRRFRGVGVLSGCEVHEEPSACTCDTQTESGMLTLFFGLFLFFWFLFLRTCPVYGYAYMRR